MKWSFKIGRFAGIDVFVHSTFFLLPLWIGLQHWRAGSGVAQALAGIGFVLLIFLCVVLHEYGHALTARRYGVTTRDIILLPIGGVARLERMPEKPAQELVVALAGPAVNVVIAAGCVGWLAISGVALSADTVSMVDGPVAGRLLAVNIMLVLFNLLPAFPMDGGRVLRALLSMRLGAVRATRIAATVGQAFAVVLGFWGLFTSPVLVLVALFVWVGAAQEAGMVEVRAALGGIALRQIMISDFHWLEADDTLARAVELTLAGSQKDFPVLAQGVVVGVLTQPQLLRALEERGRTGRVGDVMATSFETADVNELAEVVFRRLQACECRTIPVVSESRLVGLVTMENVGEYLSIRHAIRRH